MTVPVQTAEPEATYCLACEKEGHRTTECWSTHGLNTPAALELHRLCTAALREGAVQPAEARPEPVAWMWEQFSMPYPEATSDEWHVEFDRHPPRGMFEVRNIVRLYAEAPEQSVNAAVPSAKEQP